MCYGIQNFNKITWKLDPYFGYILFVVSSCTYENEKIPIQIVNSGTRGGMILARPSFSIPFFTLVVRNKHRCVGGEKE